MAATIRPSLVLNMDIDERQYSEDVIAEIKRSYSYVAPSVIAEKPTNADIPVENVIRLAVRMHKPYWDTSDEAACEQWDSIMPKWLTNMFSKVSATVTAANAVRAKAGDDPLPYAWMEVEFGKNVTVAQATNSDSSFPEDALSVVEQVRNLMNAGVFGEDVARVSVPAHVLWEEQCMQASEALSEADADNEVSDLADDAAVENDDLLASEEAENIQELEETVPALPFAPSFEVDRRVWGIEYADGTTRLFDTETNAFTE